jgi:hypothetical protein
MQHFVTSKLLKVIYTDFFAKKKQNLRNSIFEKRTLLFSNKKIFVRQVANLLWCYSSERIMNK